MVEKQSGPRCILFGVGFDEENTDCMKCEGCHECFIDSNKEKYKAKFEANPFQKVLSPSPARNKPPIEINLSSDVEERHNRKMIHIDFYIDMDWLKKRLGLDKGTEKSQS